MRPLRFVLLVAVLLIVTNVFAAFTATNTVQVSRANDSTHAIGLDDTKPPECAGITIQNRVTGSGLIAGTTGNDLITGASGIDTIDGLAGDDCIFGLDGNDVIDGGLGSNDVCVGGPGTDTFVGCETEIQ